MTDAANLLALASVSDLRCSKGGTTLLAAGIHPQEAQTRGEGEVWIGYQWPYGLLPAGKTPIITGNNVPCNSRFGSLKGRNLSRTVAFSETGGNYKKKDQCQELRYPHLQSSHDFPHKHGPQLFIRLLGTCYFNRRGCIFILRRRRLSVHSQSLEERVRLLGDSPDFATARCCFLYVRNLHSPTFALLIDCDSGARMGGMDKATDFRCPIPPPPVVTVRLLVDF